MSGGGRATTVAFTDLVAKKTVSFGGKRPHPYQQIQAVDISSDSKYAVVAGFKGGGNFHIYDLTKWPPPPVQPNVHEGGFSGLRDHFDAIILPDNKTTVATAATLNRWGTASATNRFYDMTQRPPKPQVKADIKTGGYSVAVTPNGKTLISGQLGYPGDVKLYDISGTAHKLLHTIKIPKTTLIGMAVSPNGRYLVGAHLNQKEFLIYDLSTTTPTLLHTVKSTTTTYQLLHFSPDGKNLAASGLSGKSGSVELWDITKLPTTAPTKIRSFGGYRAVFGPNNHHLFVSNTANSGSASIWGCCAYPKLPCGGNCYDLQTDSNNCGACGNVCPSGKVCSAGGCQ